MIHDKRQNKLTTPIIPGSSLALNAYRLPVRAPGADRISQQRNPSCDYPRSTETPVSITDGPVDSLLIAA